MADASTPSVYPDGRLSTKLRLDAVDSGPIIRYGSGPNQCDYLGMREAICFKTADTYYLHYDGAGLKGWLACLATSKDLRHWDLKGPVLDFGTPEERDSKTASSPWTIFDSGWWHMFYLGCIRTSRAPDRIPIPPYFTLKAKSKRPDGPWIKQENVVPFLPKPGTYYSTTASPGQIVKHGDEYLMFFSAAKNLSTEKDKWRLNMTLGIARARDLNGPWQVDPEPVLPADHQIENSALYFEPTNQTWFLFANHIGMDREAGEYTDAIWVYWSRSLTKWDPEKRAIVLDHKNCHWNARCIGMPSVVKVGNRLALFYDAPAGDTRHMKRDIGLAWLSLPLKPPA